MKNDASDAFDRIILVDKPAGISSFGVVARVRRKLSQEYAEKEKGREQPETRIHSAPGATRETVGVPRKRKLIKVGHTGTLDPFATGLLILVSGKFTRRAGEFSGLDKVYKADFRLGATSTTGDPEGEITVINDRKPTLAEVEKVLAKFTGEITQTPPIYSAIKVGGQRAYKLARKGQDVAVPPRRVTIYALELLAYDYPDLRVRAHVSSGTYIRSLAVDIGEALGVGAYTAALRRVRVGEYDVRDAETLADFESQTN